MGHCGLSSFIFGPAFVLILVVSLTLFSVIQLYISEADSDHIWLEHPGLTASDFASLDLTADQIKATFELFLLRYTYKYIKK